jgi:class 3 adenylate cyclase
MLMVSIEDSLTFEYRNTLHERIANMFQRILDESPDRIDMIPRIARHVRLAPQYPARSRINVYERAGLYFVDCSFLSDAIDYLKELWAVFEKERFASDTNEFPPLRKCNWMMKLTKAYCDQRKFAEGAESLKIGEGAFGDGGGGVFGSPRDKKKVVTWELTAEFSLSFFSFSHPEFVLFFSSFHLSLPPLSHENEPMFGVACAIEAARSLREFPQLRGFSIGVSSGIAYNGTVGSSTRVEHTALGACVNDAARLSE